MLEMNGFMIVESKEDWDNHYDKNWKRFNGCVFGGGVPKEFPMAYVQIDSWDPHFCDSLNIISIETAKAKMKNFCETKINNYSDFIQKLEKF